MNGLLLGGGGGGKIYLKELIFVVPFNFFALFLVIDFFTVHVVYFKRFVLGLYFIANRFQNDI